MAFFTAAALHFLLACLAPAAQEAGGPQPGEPQEAAADPEAALPPVEEPPALSKVAAPKAERAIKKLRGDSADYRRKAEAEVVALGRGAIPELERAAVTPHEGQQESIVNCLAELADLRDRERVAAAFSSPLLPLRRFAARKVGDYGTAVPALVDELLAALEDEDVLVRTEAAISLLRCGRDEGLKEAALAHDGPFQARVYAALPGVAGKGDHASLAALLVVDPVREKEDAAGAAKERLAAVRLLAAVGDPASRALLVRALDDKHNLVQRSAINALRHLLEGAGELETISTFDQIKEVQRLKALWAERKAG